MQVPILLSLPFDIRAILTVGAKSTLCLAHRMCIVRKDRRQCGTYPRVYVSIKKREIVTLESRL